MSLGHAAEIKRAYEKALPAIVARSAALVGPSLAEELAALPGDLRAEILDALTPADFASLASAWEFWSRPKQRAPWSDTSWSWMLYLAGRGSGKSRSGAEFCRELVESGVPEIALLGPTYGHILHFMLGGKAKKKNGSGLLDIFPKHQKPKLWHSDKLVEFHTGAVAYILTGEDEEVRGANLGGAWIDEPIKIRRIVDLFDNLELTMRADEMIPRGIITTTPKPGPAGLWLMELMAREDVYTVGGSTYENAANLAPSYIKKIERRYGGTTIGRQEIDGKILDDEEGKLFKLGAIEDARKATHPPLTKGYICVDPAASDSKRADDVGVVGIALGDDDELYIFGDASGKLSPTAYASAAITMHGQWSTRVADLAILVESDKFGQHVAATIRGALDRTKGTLAAAAIRIEETSSGGRDKATRAHPVSVLCDRGMLHVVGHLPDLEAEITNWEPGRKSPGRLDALVHGAIRLARLDEDRQDTNPSAGFEGIVERNARMPSSMFGGVGDYDAL